MECGGVQRPYKGKNLRKDVLLFTEFDALFEAVRLDNRIGPVHKYEYHHSSRDEALVTTPEAIDVMKIDHVVTFVVWPQLPFSTCSCH